MKTSVHCHSGYRFDEKPMAFQMDGIEYTITKILAEWKSENQHGFKVQTSEKEYFQLLYDESIDSWQVTPIQ